MTSSLNIPGLLSIPSSTNTGLNRISPEPKNRLGNSFASMLKTAAGTLLDTGTDMLGINSEYASLLQMQIDAQKDLQVVSMLSNVEKSKHETQMAAIRNIRVG